MIGIWMCFITQVPKFGALHKKLGLKHAKFGAVFFYYFRLSSGISPERVKISRIEITYDQERLLHILVDVSLDLPKLTTFQLIGVHAP